MNGWTFREITNSLGVMYSLTLIVILLMIIAFRNHPALRPRSPVSPPPAGRAGAGGRRSPRHA